MVGYGAAFDVVRRRVTGGTYPTAVLGVATADGVVALDAFGATGVRTARVDDAYRLFSITKPLVGIAAARAIERGLLTSQTPLREAVPEFGTGRDDTVRLEHLASHTSGISEPALDTPIALRRALIDGGRDFAAGTASRYSSVAFAGIHAMLRHTTGLGWEQAVDAWADPIGAHFTTDEAADPHVVVGAAEAGLDIDRFTALRHPGAGAIGTAGDLLALGTDLLRTHRSGDAGVLRAATLRMMLRPHTGDIPRLDPYPAERGQDWGFTWNLRTRAPGLIDRDVYGHGGWSGTEFWVHPSAGVAWVLLTNVALPPVDPDAIDNAVISAL